MHRSGGSGRGWLLAAAGVAALVVLLTGSPSYDRTAQAAGGSTPAATATPRFQWIVSDRKDPRNTIHVDPFEKRFRVDYVDEDNRLVQGTAISVPSMRKTDRLVTFKYTDQTQSCYTPTPVPSGAPPPPSRRPAARCPFFVWATLDRQRQEVRATIFRRTTSGHSTAYVNNRPTALPLPVAPDPAVRINNFQLQPKTSIVKPEEQLSFQNNTTLACQIVFDNTKQQARSPADEVDKVIDIPPGQVSRPFPRLLPTPTPTASPDGTPQPKPDIWVAGTHTYTGHCGSINLKGEVKIG